MSQISRVLIAANQNTGREHVLAAGYSPNTTLVVSRPEQLRGRILDWDVEVMVTAEPMRPGVVEAIREQLHFAQAFSGPSPAELAERLVDVVTARLGTAHHQWEPGNVLAHAVVAELVAVLDRTSHISVKRDFLAQVAGHIAAALPSAITEPADSVTRIGPRYATVLLVDALSHGPALMEALSLHADSTLVVSLASHLDDVALLDDVEVIDRTVAMPAACRTAIDEQLERCKQRGDRR